MHVYVCMYCYLKITFPAHICQMFSVFHASKFDGSFKFDVWSSKDFKMTKNVFHSENICTQIAWGVPELKHKSSCLSLVLNFITCREKYCRSSFPVISLSCIFIASMKTPLVLISLIIASKASSPPALCMSMTQ